MTEHVNPAADELPAVGSSPPLANLPVRDPLLSWLAATGLVWVAIGIAAAQAPARVRLLGLFLIAAGWSMGAASGMFAQSLRVRVSSRVALAVGGLALVALAASTWQAFRLDTASRAVSPHQQQMAVNLMQQMERDSAGQVAVVPVTSTTDEFRRYLARRVKQLGDWSSPWPELFWLVELLAGGIAAALGLQWGAAKGLHHVHQPDSVV